MGVLGMLERLRVGWVQECGHECEVAGERGLQVFQVEVFVVGVELPVDFPQGAFGIVYNKTIANTTELAGS